MQPRRIVVGVDFSDASLAAARWAVSHFAPDAEAVLVHVAPTPWVPSYARAHLRPPAEISAARGAALHGALRGLAELVDPRRTRIELVAGDPAEALAIMADELGADAICVGRGKRRRGSARFGATTSHRLLARTRLPTLVVPRGSSAAPAHTVVGVEERSGGRHVLGAACRLAAAYGASVDTLHVIEPEVEDFVNAAADVPDLPATVSDSVVDEVFREADRVLHAAWLLDRARRWIDGLLEEVAAGMSRVAPAVRFGDAGSEIVRHARESAADLVVMGRGGDVSRAWGAGAGAPPFGSTARLVTWAAPCPVLVLPAHASLTAVPPPRERERGHRADANVIPLRSPRRGSSDGVPPAARRGDAGEEECA